MHSLVCGVSEVFVDVTLTGPRVTHRLRYIRAASDHHTAHATRQISALIASGVISEVISALSSKWMPYFQCECPSYETNI